MAKEILNLYNSAIFILSSTKNIIIGNHSPNNTDRKLNISLTYCLNKIDIIVNKNYFLNSISNKLFALFGSIFPARAFMTCPTKNPIAVSFHHLYCSTMVGLAAKMVWMTAMISSSFDCTASNQSSFTNSSGDLPVAIICSIIILYWFEMRFPSSIIRKNETNCPLSNFNSDSVRKCSLVYANMGHAIRLTVSFGSHPSSRQARK